jgi:hypothetical protein
MAREYTNFFHSTALQSLPKFEFFGLKNPGSELSIFTIGELEKVDFGAMYI